MITNGRVSKKPRAVHGAAVMSQTDLAERFDSFQADAVSAIVRDFSRKGNGRYLLVIPTGGGKTITAAKAVNQLFDRGTLDSSLDTVLWTAHRTELLDQASAAYSSLTDLCQDHVRYAGRVCFEMITSVKRKLENHASISLVVIDEAHHGAANSYQPIFQRENLGVLGLTATPSRHDGMPLAFERESYSIGFPDLVKKGIILRPEVRIVEGGTYEIDSLDSDDDLGVLDNARRNQEIIAELLRHPEDYKKVVIYVGTRSHVRNLYRALLNSPLKSLYQSIAYITGEGNSRNQDRRQFVETEKGFDRSIVVNVHVLSEGYDDPSVNTAVMATPTRSKLYYMQAMGRVIRKSPEDPLKKALVVEVEDNLPNIRYRIDNRWLYADISDVLEPAVSDLEFTSADEFADKLNAIYNEYSVSDGRRFSPILDEHDRYTLLLFKVYAGPGNFKHLPMLITRDNRLRVSNMFNFLSERMATFKRRHVNSEAAFRMVGPDALDLVPDRADRRKIYSAMENAVPAEDSGEQPRFINEGHPWITFVAFHYRQPSSELSTELLEFTSEMVNRDQILDQIRRREFEAGAYLIRLPLPLKSYIGRVVTARELGELEGIMATLQRVKAEQGDQDHRQAVYAALSGAVFPIELAHTNSLVALVREELPYKMALA